MEVSGMKLRGTQTEKNLLLAYHGESNNRNLYTYFADRAREDGYEQIAAVFLETADHEREHARQELYLLGNSDIVLPTMTFPLKGIGDTPANLETAASGEHYEQTVMYPEFAETAAQEGFSEISSLLLDIAAVEAMHEERFDALLKNVKEGKVFRRDTAVTWKCRVCGFVKTDKACPRECPICRWGRAYFEVHGTCY
jgi:rubrerythrin